MSDEIQVLLRPTVATKYRDVIVKIGDEDCFPVVTRYAGPPNIRLDLWTVADDEPMCRVTTQFHWTKLPDNEVTVKDYGENMGIVPVLQKAKILGEFLRMDYRGKCPIHQLLVLLKESKPVDDVCS